MKTKNVSQMFHKIFCAHGDKKMNHSTVLLEAEYHQIKYSHLCLTYFATGHTNQYLSLILSPDHKWDD